MAVGQSGLSPLNHTIPVIEFIEFDRQVFVVMPRWDYAYWCDFTEVAEVLRYGRDFLQAVTFLHENGISHGDIRSQNMVTDLILPIESPNAPKLAGLRTQKRRYAFIDFETAALPSHDMNTNGAYQQDLRDLARALEPNLRCVSDVVPGLDHLLDSMKIQDDFHPLSAVEALARYEEICAALDDEVLSRSVEVTWVSNGIFFPSPLSHSNTYRL
ncbi:hypothetical protein C0991_000941 [Blastosporella zonata]|nr:hypothetical protein C0991_000941 [Blastosporella zonata]